MRDYRGTNPGASVLVARGGDVVFRKSYGMANIEAGIGASPSTHYRLASITKQFTAAAIMTLAENGRLSFDDPVRKHLPSLPMWAEPMTIRHLLTHTSGVIDYESVIPKGMTAQLKDAEVLGMLEGETTTYFPAGTSYRYSNTGYAFLALIVERVSGMRFAAFLRDQVFGPAGMRSSLAHEDGMSTVPGRAYGYSRDGERWKRTDQSLTSAVLGDGGIYASIDELARWLAALDGGRFAAAAEPLVATSDQEVHYGFGWRVAEHRGRRTAGHTGETMGFRNAMVRFPEERLAVV
ncbi:MAG TPA: serine hydrolase domain-containing protein, partial [Thermoanaerobaculia bacterium]|nr:serine hydrolase domain-containing protein [Thermoanaerobaculia bacterium]